MEKAKVQYSQAKQAYESNLAETQATDAAAEAETTVCCGSAESLFALRPSIYDP